MFLRIVVLVWSLCFWVQFSDSRVTAQTKGVDTVERDVSVIYFPKATEGLRRKKREWVIPELSFPENDRGPFPKKVSQIRSTNGRQNEIRYSISGPGADEPPVGLFTMDPNTGYLYVNRPLDREKKANYTLMAYADAGALVEKPKEITVKVGDLNDHKPIFSQKVYIGRVTESSPFYTEILQVKATDADEEGTMYSAVRYRIMNQDPNYPSDQMFTIDPVTGSIRLNARGLDRQKTPQYTLQVTAADLEGHGLISYATVIVTVTDNSAPYTQTQGLDFEQTSTHSFTTTSDPQTAQNQTPGTPGGAKGDRKPLLKTLFSASLNLNFSLTWFSAADK